MILSENVDGLLLEMQQKRKILRHVKRSFSQKNAIQNRQNALVELARQQVDNDTRIFNTDDERIRAITCEYENALAIYLFQPTLKFFTQQIKAGTRQYKLWLRAAAQADKCEVSYKEYIRSQFWVFDVWYKRAPNPNEVASSKSLYNAMYRVEIYKDALKRGDVKDTTIICSSVRTAPETSQVVKNKISEQQLRSLMYRCNADVETIFKNYAGINVSGIFFDRVWLASHPVYIRLKINGDI